MFKWIIQKVSGPLKVDRSQSLSGFSITSDPVPGSIYCFKTTPLYKHGNIKTDRFAAFKILSANKDHYSIAVLDGIWGEPPTVKQVSYSKILTETRFTFDGRSAVFGLSRDWWKPSEDLVDVAWLGSVPLSREENEIAGRLARMEVGSLYSTLQYINSAAEGEWCWKFDRALFEIEVAHSRAAAEKDRQMKETRYKNRLKHLTWDKLLSETFFERWHPSPPFPPETFTLAARDVLRSACEELRNLGDKPKKAHVRLILKRSVEWLNHADVEYGGVIETEEREDICSLLEEIAFVARHKSLVDEIDNWRSW